MTIRDGRDGILQGCKTPSHIVTPSRKGQWKHIKHMHIDKRIQRINLEELHEKEHSDAILYLITKEEFARCYGLPGMVGYAFTW